MAPPKTEYVSAPNIATQNLHHSFPALRACIFDMDGLLLNTEDIITQSTNHLLTKYARPPLPRSLRAQLMGVADSTNGALFHNWADLPVSRAQFAREAAEDRRVRFAAGCVPLPGAEALLANLSRAFTSSSSSNDEKIKVELALASGTKSASYEAKTTRPETKRLLGWFAADRRVLGDDARVPRGRGKPAPDIYLVALQSLNAGREKEEAILPEECLVFEDSVVGVEAARRAGMRVVWVPHADVAGEYWARRGGGSACWEDGGCQGGRWR